ncbi:hypothetical protein ROHU_023283 [Labeo rohita]|uniref:Uncharacterized protein n=1 Tax=Labeo rohita TaxID=84645 RepID=A0A498MS49_LABRO|nr:hypothetical protein ROHU_023283 [Labeo rohita]
MQPVVLLPSEVLAFIHQTPASSEQYGDAYALMFTWSDLTGPGQKRGCAESTGRGSNHREDEESVSPLVQPCRLQWKRIPCQISTAPYFQWTATDGRTKKRWMDQIKEDLKQDNVGSE